MISHRGIGDHMADIPVITGFRTRNDGNTAQWPVLVSLHCDTENGPQVVRITGEAAHQLRGLLEKLPPRLGKRPPTQSL